MTDRWYAVDVRVVPEAVEAVESALELFEPLGTEIDGLRKRADEPLVVTAFFEQPPPIRGIEDAVAAELVAFGHTSGGVEIAERVVEKEDWLAAWKSHWRPTRIGRFIVTPPWIAVDDDGIVITIEPNMAFGTGTHETTQLCLEAIGETVEPGTTFLDVGTGTGILSIAAAKLGAIVTACDTDEESVAIARENAVLNDVGDKIAFFEGPITADTPPARVVAANLTLDAIGPILGMLVERAEQTLILSGVLTTQEDDLCRELSAAGVDSLDIRRSGEWIAAVVRRPAASQA